MTTTRDGTAQRDSPPGATTLLVGVVFPKQFVAEAERASASKSSSPRAALLRCADLAEELEAKAARLARVQEAAIVPVTAAFITSKQQWKFNDKVLWNDAVAPSRIVVDAFRCLFASVRLPLCRDSSMPCARVLQIILLSFVVVAVGDGGSEYTCGGYVGAWLRGFDVSALLSEDQSRLRPSFLPSPCERTMFSVQANVLVTHTALFGADQETCGFSQSLRVRARPGQNSLRSSWVNLPLSGFLSLPKGPVLYPK